MNAFPLTKQRGLGASRGAYQGGIVSNQQS